MNNLTEFGKCMKLQLLNHNLHTVDVAEMMNYSPAYLSAIFHGKRKPTIKFLNKYLRSLTKLLTEDEVNDIINTYYSSEHKLVIDLIDMSNTKRGLAYKLILLLNEVETDEDAKLWLERINSYVKN